MLDDVEYGISMGFKIATFDSSGNSSTSNTEVGYAKDLIIAHDSNGEKAFFTVAIDGTNLVRHEIIYEGLYLTGSPQEHQISPDGSTVYFSSLFNLSLIHI